MPFFSITSLRTRLIVTILASLIPALGIDFYYARSDFGKAEISMRKDAQNLVRLAKNHHAETLDNAHHLLDALANLPVIQGSTAGCSVFLAQLLHGYPDFNNFGVVNANGKVMCEAAPAVPSNLSQMDFFRQAIDTHNFAVGPYLTNPATSESSIFLGKPLYDRQGRLQEVIFSQISLSRTSRLHAYADFLPSAVLTVFDNQGVILDRYPDPKSWTGKRFRNAQLVKAAIALNGEGVDRLPDISGEMRVYAFTKIEDAPTQKVFLAVGIPLESAYAGPRRVLYGDLTSAAIAGILIILISWIAIDHFILRNLSMLLRTTNLIRHGDLSARTEIQSRDDEMGQLASAVDEMAAALEEKVSGQHETEQSLLQLTKMSELLQISSNMEEASTIAARFARRLFSDGIGALYMRQPVGLFEPLTTWGEIPEKDRMFTADDCWAVRRGKPYMWDATENAGPRCHHVSDPNISYICFPIIAQGQIIGIIHLRSRLQISALQGQYGPSIVQLAETYAEQTGLALANLRLRVELQDQAIRDPLTGLYNRRYMEEVLGREMQRAIRHHLTISFIMLDIDFFKKVNDTYGHETGDMVLQSLAVVLREHVRGSDIACRYGGEEFIVILPGTSLEDAVHRAESLRETVRGLRLVNEGRDIGPVTVSLGVACFPVHGQTWQAVVQAADAALYTAKQAGRDQVQVAHPQA